jgi:hypothetical protein
MDQHSRKLMDTNVKLSELANIAMYGSQRKSEAGPDSVGNHHGP